MKSWLAAGWLYLVCMLFATQAAAGIIQVSNVETTYGETGLGIEADVVIELNPMIEKGLLSGVPLYFNVEVRLYKARRFWPDRLLAEKHQRISLAYYELTRHYRVSVAQRNATRNFRSLLDALSHVGQIRGVLFEPELSLPSLVPVRAEIRMYLDANALPLPLQPQTLFGSSWKLKTEPFEWQID